MVCVRRSETDALLSHNISDIVLVQCQRTVLKHYFWDVKIIERSLCVWRSDSQTYICDPGAQKQS